MSSTTPKKRSLDTDSTTRSKQESWVLICIFYQRFELPPQLFSIKLCYWKFHSVAVLKQPQGGIILVSHCVLLLLLASYQGPQEDSDRRLSRGAGPTKRTNGRPILFLDAVFQANVSSIYLVYLKQNPVGQTAASKFVRHFFQATTKFPFASVVTKPKCSTSITSASSTKKRIFEQQIFFTIKNDEKNRTKSRFVTQAIFCLHLHKKKKKTFDHATCRFITLSVSPFLF